MDWVSATYNRLEGLAVAADRFLGTVVERCEDWMAGRRAGTSAEIGSEDGHDGAVAAHDPARPRRPLSA
jgi:hypothetical protein